MKKMFLKIIVACLFLMAFIPSAEAGIRVDVFVNGSWRTVILNFGRCDDIRWEHDAVWRNCVDFMVAPGAGGGVLDDSPDGAIELNDDNTAINFRDKLTGLETLVVDLNTVPSDQFVEVVLSPSNDGGIVTYYPLSDFGSISETRLAVDKESESPFSIYPNPANDQLMINSTQNIQEIKVVDVQGRQVMMETNVNQGQYTLEVSHLKHGVYFVFVSDGNTIRKERVVVQ